MKQAAYCQTLENGRVLCRLCPHECKVAVGQYGICGVRRNVDGILYSLVYEKVIATHIDPIEKKPFFHLYPGSRSYSLATAGCNFSCQFCQNHDISQIRKPDDRLGETLPAEQVVREAAAAGCKTIACTYTEPTIFFEYALDVARAARGQGVHTVWVTNGYINEDPLREIAPYLLAANVDLKGWDEEFYRKVVGGRLQPVLDTLKRMKQLGIWVEVTTLVVPGYIDREEPLREIAQFIKNELGAETPWHLSRFHPQYRCSHLPMTPISILRRAREIGLETGLRYVYSGNVPGDVGEHTFCHHCGARLIERFGFQVISLEVREGACPICGTAVAGIF